MAVFFFPVRIILETLFTIKTRRPYSTFSFTNSNILDLTFCLLIAIRLDREYRLYQVGLDDLEFGSYEFYEKYYNNIYVIEDDDALLSYLYALGTFLAGIKALYLF